MTYFWLHDKHLAYFWYMTISFTWLRLFDKRFEVITNILSSWRVFTSWRIFWRQGELSDAKTYFWRHEIFFSVMTSVLTSWLVYDIDMTNVLTSWNFLTTWHTFWRLDALFDVMSNFMTSYGVFFTFCWDDVFLTPWSAFCRLDIFFFIISGTKYNENFLTSWRVFVFITNCLTLWRIFDFMTHFLTSWHMFYFMTNLGRHDKPFDVMVCFDAMTHCVTLWRTWWRLDKLCDVITVFFFILW